MAVNDDLLNKAISHQIGLIRYGSSIVQEVINILNQLEELLLDRITRTELQQSRVNALLKAIQRTLSDIYDQVEDNVEGSLIDLAAYEAAYQTAVLRQTIPITLTIAQPTTALLNAVVTATPFEGGLLTEWVQGLEEGQFKRLRSAIRTGILEGASGQQLVRTIRGTAALRYRDGILEIGKRSAEAMVRTAVNHTATRAREIFYGENADLIKGVRWVATLDSRTTPVCRARDGQVFKPNEGPRPPAHINCRSTTTPITKSWRELGYDIDEIPAGTRASMNGQVPADLTYNEWLKTQSAAFQDDVLGPARGKLFRANNLSLDRFVDSSGRQYTLKELRKREGL